LLEVLYGEAVATSCRTAQMHNKLTTG